MPYEENTFTANIRGVSDLVESGINKVPAGDLGDPEGVTGDKIDVLDLPMSDDELLKLRDEYEKAYAPYEGKVAIPIAKRNLRSYLGRNKDNSVPADEEIVAANLQFESEETFLPAATAQDPAPFVFSDDTPEGNEISKIVQTMLQFHAQQLLLRRKLAVMTRQWSIYQLGVIKAGWDETINDVMLDNRKIQDFVFDPNGYVDVYGNFSSWLGERVTCTAEKLIDLYPNRAEYIRLEVDGKLGTEVTYTEWWNDEYSFTTFKKKILEKHKNQYFNYEEKPETDELTGLMSVTPQKRNHFATPKKPYIFLSVFSLQERPHDITGLIEQNIPNQSLITKRTQQIDINISSSNNGYAYSENNFNQETGKQAANARRTGNPILIPAGGPIAEAIVPLPAQAIPNGFFDALEVNKNDLRSSWGTQGIASQQQKPDETARGMILNQGRDTSRIGGGVVDILEQSVAKTCFDWLVQLYHVFYDQRHFGAVMGTGKATEYVQLQSSDIDRQLIVGVTPNSMKPKDQISQMNQATELYQMKAIGPKTLLEALNFPNPDEAAGDGVLWNIDPVSYLKMNFPELAQQLEQLQAQSQQMQQQQMAQEQANQQAQVGQQLQQKEQAHQQKLGHLQQTHEQKLKQAEETASQRMAQLPIPNSKTGL